MAAAPIIHRPSRRARRRPRASAVAALAVFVSLTTVRTASAQTQTAAALFERAQDQAKQLTDSSAADALRRTAKTYQSVVLQFPASAYCDNALWEAGLLIERAWQQFSETRDRDDAIKIFTWLAKEYPGALGRKAAAHITDLKTPPVVADVKSQAAPPIEQPAAVVAPDATDPASAGLPVGQARSGPAITVRSIARTPLPKGDRITIELSDEAPYTGDRVSNPDRIFFDFSNAALAATVADDLKKVNGALIKAVRVGSPAKGITRVVMELTGTPRYSAFFLYNPFRLVVDVETTAPGGLPAVPSTSSASPAPPVPAAVPAVFSGPSPIAPSSTGRGDFSLPRQLGLRVAKIVIDPGHGGHDPGAISNGVQEADVVLDIALRLEALLEQMPGVEVVLTRRTNEFIPLEERTAIASREKADLFLSIHANSHHSSAVSGIETYFLNFASNPDAEALAARENAASLQTMGTLPAIVKAISLNSKLEESRELATMLQATLTRKARTQSTAARDLGVKQAPFVVLIGAQMPSVLVETGFLTNKTEAGLLKQPAYRQLLAQALRDAVVKYQDSLKRVSNASAQPKR